MPYYPMEPFGRLVEFRQQLLRDLPEMRASIQRLLLISEVGFSTRIQGYGSLDLGITPSSIGKLAKAFSGEFETFAVLLDAFVPRAFGGVFTSQFADGLAYQVTVPQSFRDAFAVAGSEEVDTPPISAQAVSGQTTLPTDSRLSDAAKKAEWVWRLANGSLLVPVLLALVVLYFGVKELAAFRNTQYEALKPILEHHMLLLKEDRERMFPKPVPRAESVSTEKASQQLKAGADVPATSSPAK